MTAAHRLWVASLAAEVRTRRRPEAMRGSLLATVASLHRLLGAAGPHPSCGRVWVAAPPKGALLTVSGPQGTAGGTGEGAARHFGEAPEVWTCGQNSYGELAHLDTVTRKTHSFVECLKDKDIIHVAAGECHLGSTPPHVCRPLPAAHRCLLLATCR